MVTLSSWQNPQITVGLRATRLRHGTRYRSQLYPGLTLLSQHKSKGKDIQEEEEEGDDEQTDSD